MSQGKFYKSIKTGQTAELVGKNEHGAILLLPDGEERILAQSTLKRWWKVVDTEVPTEDTSYEQAAATKETEQSKTPKKADKSSVKLDDKVAEQFIISAHKLAETVDAELFVRPNTGSYNFRKNGKIYMYFVITRKGVQVYARTKAIGFKFNHITVNHNYDAKIVFTDWNSDIYTKFAEIHALSYGYLLNKQK